MFTRILFSVALSVMAIPAVADSEVPALPEDLSKQADGAIEAYRSYFESLDVDKSGRITRDELRLASEKRHSSFDLNADGYVSAEEYASRDASISPAQAMRRVQNIDSDGDNRISKEEAQNVALDVLRFDADRSGDLVFSEIMISAPPVVKRYFDNHYSKKR
jgi:Ca2+-binding EF-hand superfamily protein